MRLPENLKNVLPYNKEGHRYKCKYCGEKFRLKGTYNYHIKKEKRKDEWTTLIESQ